METFWSLKKWWASCCWFLCSQPNPVASLEQQKGPLFLPALGSFHWLCVGDKQRPEVQRGSDVWGEAGPSVGLHELTEQLLIGHLCWVPFFFCTTVLCLHLLVWELWQQTLHTLPTSSCPSFWQSWQSEFQFYLPSEAQWPELLLPLQLSGRRFWGWEGSPEAVVREIGRGDSGELSVREAKCRRRAKEGLSRSAVLSKEAAAGGLEVRPGLSRLPPHPGSVTDTLGKSCSSFSLIFPIRKWRNWTSLYPCSHPDSKIWDFHFFALWHWI